MRALSGAAVVSAISVIGAPVAVMAQPAPSTLYGTTLIYLTCVNLNNGTITRQDLASLSDREYNALLPICNSLQDGVITPEESVAIQTRLKQESNQINQTVAKKLQNQPYLQGAQIDLQSVESINQINSIFNTTFTPAPF